MSHRGQTPCWSCLTCVRQRTCCTEFTGPYILSDVSGVHHHQQAFCPCQALQDSNHSIDLTSNNKNSNSTNINSINFYHSKNSKFFLGAYYMSSLFWAVDYYFLKKSRWLSLGNYSIPPLCKEGDAHLERRTGSSYTDGKGQSWEGMGRWSRATGLRKPSSCSCPSGCPVAVLSRGWLASHPPLNFLPVFLAAPVQLSHFCYVLVVTLHNCHT